MKFSLLFYSPPPRSQMEKSEIVRPISTILDGSNYITWENQMKSFLISWKLWRIVTGDITKPTKQHKEDDSKFIERLKKWDNKNHQIITWLSNTSIPAIHTQFDAFENAKELWDFLSTLFKFVGLAHYYQLHNSLVNLNQEVCQSVNEYLVVLQPIWTQLDQAKISKDHLRLIKVLMGHRQEYVSVRAGLLHRSPLPSLDAVIQKILFEEKRLGINLSKNSDVVLVGTYSPSGASSTFCKNCKLTGHKFIGCPKIECRFRIRRRDRRLGRVAKWEDCLSFYHFRFLLLHPYLLLSLTLIHISGIFVLGPAPTSIIHGYRYYVLFIDDFSRFTWIYFLKNCSELSHTYIEFAKMIHTQFSCPIKILRTNNALEYKDSTLLSFLSQQGTLVQRSCPHTSQQNGCAKHKHRHILDLVRALLLSASCSENFWGEAALTSVYTINRLPSSVL
ncbi:Copia protein [Cucumis melo var. makuwa]|uniref:Copia protein n=1 Tax=Cucumis melo var. makuwa TaxID=1194695 RepID=A0A5D3BG55_CUCMM|nr:Copia protein [Cucumis melo var. makuwa]